MYRKKKKYWYKTLASSDPFFCSVAVSFRLSPPPVSTVLLCINLFGAVNYSHPHFVTGSVCPTHCRLKRSGIVFVCANCFCIQYTKQRMIQAINVFANFLVICCDFYSKICSNHCFAISRASSINVAGCWCQRRWWWWSWKVEIAL